MSRPVVLLVDNDSGELEAVEGKLSKRQGADYRALARRSPVFQGLHRPCLVSRFGLAAITGAARLTPVLHAPSWPPMCS